mmetsp:Transcript_150781/g.482547  ORF Transcript_150781/g.482547 Transcript_150781/m.482547 type:complete len:212 (+) Transcript_150781:286-921(+)
MQALHVGSGLWPQGREARSHGDGEGLFAQDLPHFGKLCRAIADELQAQKPMCLIDLLELALPISTWQEPLVVPFHGASFLKLVNGRHQERASQPHARQTDVAAAITCLEVGVFFSPARPRGVAQTVALVRPLAVQRVVHDGLGPAVAAASAGAHGLAAKLALRSEIGRLSVQMPLIDALQVCFSQSSHASIGQRLAAERAGSSRRRTCNRL